MDSVTHSRSNFKIKELDNSQSCVVVPGELNEADTSAERKLCRNNENATLQHMIVTCHFLWLVEFVTSHNLVGVQVVD